MNNDSNKWTDLGLRELLDLLQEISKESENRLTLIGEKLGRTRKGVRYGIRKLKNLGHESEISKEIYQLYRG